MPKTTFAPHMLTTSQLTYAYKNGTSFRFPDVQCSKGEHLLIIGESGTGKTTLLHLLAGLLSPVSGQITIANTNINSLRGKALDKFRGSHIGIVFQTSHFVQSLTAEENLLMPQFLTNAPLLRERAASVMARLGLSPKLKQKPARLSVGEQQRLAIARAVMNNPAVILADEPTSALDDRNAREVIAMLEEQALLTDAALIIVTHDKRLKDRFQKQIAL
ncbi:MAG: ABC transporter ATP-binding protein [Flavobacteriales bacterium]